MEAQMNYATTEKENLAFDKFCSNLIGLDVSFDTNHSTLKYMLAKNEIEITQKNITPPRI